MEPITSLLDAFIKLADRIINLEKTKLQDKRDIFNEIVQPLFDELEPVASNYVDFFRKARDTIVNGTRKDLRKIADEIAKDRDAMLMARIKVRAMADQVKEHIKDNDVVEFAMAINDFFYKAHDPAYTDTLISNAHWLLIVINDVAERHDAKEQIKQFDYLIDEIIDSQKQSWDSIVKSYEKIRIFSVSSPKHIRKNRTKKPES